MNSIVAFNQYIISVKVLLTAQEKLKVCVTLVAMTLGLGIQPGYAVVLAYQTDNKGMICLVTIASF